MTSHLLDVNVLVALVALVDPAHVQHDQAHDWFARAGRQGFATCPITENGLPAWTAGWWWWTPSRTAAPRWR